MAPSTFTIHAGVYFDAPAKAFKDNVSIVVDPGTGAIVDVVQRDSRSADIKAGDIDLRYRIVMPGFVDAHTHIFLHAYRYVALLQISLQCITHTNNHSETPAQVQMRDESIIERTVRATRHCRQALLSGYTTYRDLGTEGMRSFDANLRDTINRGLLPGPRLFVATECLTTSGSYAVRSENTFNGTSAPPISDVCDGIDSVRAAVRRRVGAGADLIKFYADYRRSALRTPAGSLFPPTTSGSTVMFTQEEMNAIVSEARLAHLPVACHASTDLGVRMASLAGVDTIEHGNDASDAALEAMRRNNTIFVPTLAVTETLRPGQVGDAQKQAKKAWDMGVRFAAGGDTGAFNHGEGAREMELLLQAGLPVEDVLEACMVGGWESCGRDLCGHRFGWFEKGNRADIIALETDPRADQNALRKVSFVMKDAKVWKRDGIPVGFIDEVMKDAGQQTR